MNTSNKLITYEVYARLTKNHPYIKVNKLLKSNDYLQVGTHITYIQCGLFCALINKCSFEQGSNKVYVTMK